LYVAGPIITFNDFISQVRNTQTAPRLAFRTNERTKS
jgi:D-alanyl-lipoteichoic acid acyltransferase DltB (MBOAT superfamily)